MIWVGDGSNDSGAQAWVFNFLLAGREGRGIASSKAPFQIYNASRKKALGSVSADAFGSWLYFTEQREASMSSV